MKKYLFITLFIFWLLLSIVEVGGYLFFNRKFFAQSLWSLASVYDPQHGVVYPFKPLYHDIGFTYGDLLNGLYFQAKDTELRSQEYSIDEYGFRNEPRLLDKSIKAVLIGTSVVGGAAETQKNLISTILTNKYQIPTYNYAPSSLEDFWTDQRFLNNSPKYIFIIAKSNEIINEPKLLLKTEPASKRYFKKWASFAEWSESEKYNLSYSHLQMDITNFSLLRHSTNSIIATVLNKLLTRSQIASLLHRKQFVYEDRSKMIFLSPAFEPLTINDVKTETSHTMVNLQNTQTLLNKRKITLVVISIPTKAELYASRFDNLLMHQRVSVGIESEMKKNKINYIPIASDIIKLARDNKKVLYYQLDSHWNAEMNKIIAEKIYHYSQSTPQGKN